MRFLSVLSALVLFASCTSSGNLQYLLISSYASAEEEGIKVYTFDQGTGDFEYKSALCGISNPSFVFPSADGKFVYAVGEDVVPEVPTANALSFDKETATLSLLNTQPNPGDAPCNIIISPDGKRIYTSNYFGGNIDEYDILGNGTLGEARSIEFEGNSIDTIRQTHPYLHAVNFTPDGKYLLANDLGTDCVHIFPATGPVDKSEMEDLKTHAGLGPRHLCFNPNGRFAYLLGELSGEIVTISYDAENADEKFRIIQTIKADTLDAGGSADIHASPDGKFVYASHRLKGDGISIFKVNPEDGLLQRVGFKETGVHPRNFAITPNGKFLLAACRDSNLVQIFSRDQETGLLKDTGKEISMSKPVCLQFISSK